MLLRTFGSRTSTTWVLSLGISTVERHSADEQCAEVNTPHGREKRTTPQVPTTATLRKYVLHVTSVGRWRFVSTLTEFHGHGDERWPAEVTSNTHFGWAFAPYGFVWRTLTQDVAQLSDVDFVPLSRGLAQRRLGFVNKRPALFVRPCVQFAQVFEGQAENGETTRSYRTQLGPHGGNRVGQTLPIDCLLACFANSF